MAQIRWLIVAGLLAALSGCSALPEIARQPSVYNPFPQLSKVAVAPFFNLSTEPTADGRQFAIAYYNELQSVPGFEVVPVGVVEKTMEMHHIQLDGPESARKLAHLLGVDAVAIGAITDYSPYYPPRCGLQVEWYAADVGAKPIPPGYGLPFGTPEEEEIPVPLVFETHMAMARAELKTAGHGAPPPAAIMPSGAVLPGTVLPGTVPPGGVPPGAMPAEVVPPPPAANRSGRLLSATEPVPPVPTGEASPDAAKKDIVPPVTPAPLPALSVGEPVLRHTRTYNGNDANFTHSLSEYVSFRDEARNGGWEGYLQRSDDFIRFCCHRHICEMLTARGGAGPTQVVWRWPGVR